MLGHMTMMMGHMTIMVGHMTMMIVIVRKFVNVFLRNVSKKCEEVPKIVVLGPHDHVGWVIPCG